MGCWTKSGGITPLFSSSRGYGTLSGTIMMFPNTVAITRTVLYTVKESGSWESTTYYMGVSCLITHRSYPIYERDPNI
jgi:hypothetical protein